MEATQLEAQQAAPLPQQGRGPALKLPGKKKKWLKRGFILLAAGAAIWFFFLRPKPAMAGASAQYTAAAATLRDLTVQVDASGALAPIESYQVSTLISGEILEAPFEVGDYLEKGSLLYQMDAGEARTALQQAQLSLRQAQLSYDQTLSGLTPAAGAAGVVQKVHVSKGDLVSPGTPIADIADSSTMTLELPFLSTDAARLSPGQSAQVTIDGTLEVLPGTVERVAAADLVGTGGALVRQVTIRVNNPGALTAGRSATASVGEIPCAGSGVFAENMRQTVVAQGSGQVTAVHVSAGSAVSAGTALVTLGGEGADSALESASIALETARLSLQRAQDALENYTITCPISGTVIEKNFKAGDKAKGVESGALAVVFDMSRLKLPLKINELNIGQVQPGQRVDITAEALPGQVFHGTVDRVSINGTTTNGFTTYPVTVVLDEFGALNPGMNVSAHVIVDQAKQVLCIPLAAVEGDGTVLVAGPGAVAGDGVTVLDPSKAERRTVELGRSNQDYVEITSGLEEGELVLVAQQTAEAPSGSVVVSMGG